MSRFKEFLRLAMRYKLWWMMPAIVLTIALALLALAGRKHDAPFIYTTF